MAFTTPELVAFYGRQRREVADHWSEIVKLVVLGGRYSVDHYQALHYAMARNLIDDTIRFRRPAESRSLNRTVCLTA